MSEIHGSCQDRFEPLRAQLADALASGAETGLSLCVIQDGEVLLDLWGGVADVATGRPWQQDTVVNTFSITKTMAALAALVLVDRGELDLDAPVARYWPQFAAAGKDTVLVRHVLGHTSGVAGWQQRVSLADVYDTEAAAELLAAQEPWWAPGTRSGYHAMNYGHLVDAVVRPITGASLGEFFRTEVAEPLGVDFHIGTPSALDQRIATLVPPAAQSSALTALPPDSVPVKTLGNPALDLAAVGGRAWRRAELGAMNGHGNARAVALAQAALSHGGGDLVGSRTVEAVFRTQAEGTDLVLGMPVRFGVGYALGRPVTGGGRVCWWTGYGGSLVVNDLDRRLTLAYVMNKMTPGLVDLGRGADYLRAVEDVLAAKEAVS